MDRILHGSQQRGLCKSCRRFCFACCKSSSFHSKYLTFRKLRKLLVFQLITGFLFFIILPAAFINLSPPCTFYNTSACSENFSCCSSLHVYLLIYSRRIQHTQKTAYYHIVNLPFLIGHMIQLYKLFCRNDGMMVTDFFVIHKACTGLDRFIGQRTGKFPIRAGSTSLKTFFNGRNYIFSYISGIRSWVGKDFVILIEPLHDIQSFLCRKAVFLISFSLKSGQVIKPRCIGLLRLSGNLCYGKAAFSCLCLDLLGTLLIKGTKASAFSITPGPAYISCLQSDPVIILRLKFPDLLLSSCDHGKGGGLHTSAGKLGIIFTGQCSGPVHSHQPVRLRPGLCRTVKIIIIMAVFKVGKAVADRFVRY